MEHSRVRPGAYLCRTRCWWTASQWDLSERLKASHTILCSQQFCDFLKKFTEQLTVFTYTYYCLYWLTLQVQTWSFSPLAEKTYTLKPTLTFWPTQIPECNKSHLTLKVVGMGSKGFIEVGLSCWFVTRVCVYVNMIIFICTDTFLFHSLF